MAMQLTNQMPSQCLSDIDKAYLAHAIGIHALYHRLLGVGTKPTDLITMLSSLKTQSTDRQIEDLLRAIEEIQYRDAVSNKSWRGYSDLKPYVGDKELISFRQKVMEVLFGGVREPSYRGKGNSNAQQNIYAYVLLRYNDRGFQHYARRLNLVIPSKLENTIMKCKQIIKANMSQPRTIPNSIMPNNLFDSN